MTKEEFVQNARDYLKEKGILEESGCVLYSAFSTLKRGRFYILGLNPGGTPDSKDTIAQDLEELPTYNTNAYIDEAWGRYKPGKHPLQYQLKLLIESKLGENLREICASNLIFRRSKNQNEINYPDSADLCWPVHQMILDIVKPDVIITFGNGSISPYAYLKNKYLKNNDSNSEKTKWADWGNWKCKAFRAKNEDHDTLVLGIPHLSRYRVRGRKEEVINWIKEQIEKRK